MFVDITQQCFALLPQVNFPGNNLNFQWRWWGWIQAIFLNLFYFIYQIKARKHAWNFKIAKQIAVVQNINFKIGLISKGWFTFGPIIILFSKSVSHKRLDFPIKSFKWFRTFIGAWVQSENTFWDYTLPRIILLCPINWGTQWTMEISSSE